jgi:hypothetical protein
MECSQARSVCFGTELNFRCDANQISVSRYLSKKKKKNSIRSWLFKWLTSWKQKLEAEMTINFSFPKKKKKKKKKGKRKKTKWGIILKVPL